ncbi:50S ribosomal protein L10 [Candidatus Falkowbacteria bacterium]|uniref:Large ribosomal subunit protein uL10 n=1 Tax=Candidatus Buchananbacteria bacterium CG10_big_fil_rev_8_21_14_0_10_33_19 TaxID=1974525 RepID=A0A2H0W4F5_9BACT|nr:50S ribosomal protein L10 [Candidatus Falkowbacteria bacterium]PIS06147.1 MAG: 50S ribosomal protein L10 [Candidatus Buchananbacteria bacterium CG10_big_fil_rev_8_21_14_0_10_33_19]
MAKTKSQKKEILGGLQEKMDAMKSAVFVNFSGIPVKEINILRNTCKDENVGYVVAKKTLLKKILTEKGFSDVENSDFSGEVATVIGFEDEIAPAKLVSTFAKGHEKMKILGGVLEGALIGEDKIKALAVLPSKPELLAKAVGSIAAPLSGFVNVLSGNLRNFVYALNAISEKKSQGN